MTGPVFAVQGARELRRTLARAGSDMEDMKDAHAEVAAYVATRSRVAAPHVSGRLARSVRGNRAKGSASVKAGSASVRYAGPIHYGWPRRNISAHPFLVDTAHATEPQWRLMYLRAVDTILSRVKGA